MGTTLRASQQDLELGFDLEMPLPAVAPACTPTQLAGHAPDLDPDPFAYPTLQELAAIRFPAATYRPWLADVTV